jgi:hypothetical protein
MNRLNRPRAASAVSWILTAAAFGGALFQLNAGWESYLRPSGAQAWSLRALPAWERTAIILLGGDEAGFLSFVRETVPVQARVILPPRSRGTPYEHVGMMQYFLNPRDIHNCGKNEVDECVSRATGESTYILALYYFPPRELARQTRRLISYDDNRGVFAPP